MLLTCTNYLFILKSTHPRLTKSATLSDIQLFAMQSQLPLHIQTKPQLSKASPLCFRHEPHCWPFFYCCNEIRSSHKLTKPPLPHEEDINPRMKETATTTSYSVSKPLWTSSFFWFSPPPLSSFRKTWLLNIRSYFEKNWRLFFFAILKGSNRSQHSDENSLHSLPSFGHAFYFLIFWTFNS